MARSARWPLASGRLRSRWSSRRRRCSSASRSASRCRVDGSLDAGVTAKDIILALIARIGVGGGTGHVFEYGGSGIRALSMEERMTICNMSIEAGARAGLIAPDDTTFAYVEGRPHAPAGAAWDEAVARWRQLPSDAGAAHSKSIDARRVRARAHDHVRHEPGHGHAHLRGSPRSGVGGRRRGWSGARKGARIYGPDRGRVARLAIRSTSSSSARARTAASATCARRPA